MMGSYIISILLNFICIIVINLICMHFFTRVQQLCYQNLNSIKLLIVRTQHICNASFTISEVIFFAIFHCKYLLIIGLLSSDTIIFLLLGQKLSKDTNLVKIQNWFLGIISGHLKKKIIL